MEFSLIKEIQLAVLAESITEEFGDLLAEAVAQRKVFSQPSVSVAPKFTLSPQQSKNNAASDRAAAREWRANPKGLSRKSIQDRPLEAGNGNPSQKDVVVGADKDGTPKVYVLGARDKDGFFASTEVKTGKPGPEFLDKNLKKHFAATKGKTGKLVWKKTSK